RTYREWPPGSGTYNALWYQDDMWEYDGVNWTSNTPPVLPPVSSPLFGHVVFNPARGLIEYFHTFGSGSFDLWTYDTSNWTSRTVNSSTETFATDRNLVYINNTGTAAYVSSRGTWLWNPDTWEARFHLEAIFNRPTAWGDIDGDGRPDRVWGPQMRLDGGPGNPLNGKLLLLHNGTNLTARPAWHIADDAAISDVALGDVNNDGRLDAAFSTLGILPIEIYTNAGGAFSLTPDWQSHTTNHIRDLQFTDVDRDGDLDLAALRSTPGDVAVLVYRNEGGMLNSEPFIEVRIPPSATATDARIDFLYGGFMSWADIDFDGQQECAVAYSYPGENIEVSLLAISGTNLVQRMRFDGLRGPLGFIDMNLDGYPELFASREQDGAVLFMNQAGTFDFTPTWEA
ncbi:MAG: VCBS repeat-containing protein, partial [Verrucomicrobiota bacterium]